MKQKEFTFTLKHSSGFIQCRFDYILIQLLFKNLQLQQRPESYFNQSSFCNFLIFKGKKQYQWWREFYGFWKFYRSFSKEQHFITEIKNLTHNFCAKNVSFQPSTKNGAFKIWHSEIHYSVYKWNILLKKSTTKTKLRILVKKHWFKHIIHKAFWYFLLLW